MSAALTKLEARLAAAGSLVCIGLDPELSRLPQRFLGEPHPLFAFNQWIIDQTAEFAVAYKPNMAFYEAHGPRGLHQLELTQQYLRAHFPAHLTICDAKRADIGNTNRGYVEAIFDALGFDAVTLHPYLGQEALAPFLDRADKLSIILCRTSNPGAAELQDLACTDAAGQTAPLWQRVAERVAQHWNRHGNCMLVVGATYPEEMRRIRALAPAMTFLVPGIGAQGGDLNAVLASGLDATGRGLLLSSSRAVLFAADPAAEARALRDAIRSACARQEVSRAAH